MSPHKTDNQALATETLLVEKDDEPPSRRPLEALTTENAASLASTSSENEPDRSWSHHKSGAVRKHSKQVIAFRKRHFNDVPWSQWNDWHWQVSHRIRTVEQLERYLALEPAEREALSGSTLLPFAITPYYVA